MKELLNRGAFELGRLIRTKQVSAVEVVRTHIERIREVNDNLNAVVVERFEDALREAEHTQSQILRGQALGPLAGVPMTVKESIALEGYPLTSGSVFRAANTATQDATAVKNLKRAGAIVLGKTNVPECNFWMESFNKIYGMTRNPYDPSRTPGGSSGGEGAIVGAGGVPFGVGSDIAGSIRMPAAFCGVFGHRPTAGLIPIQGHAFSKQRPQQGLDTSEISKHLVIGPLCRRAEDLYPLTRLMAGKDLRLDDGTGPLEAGAQDWSTTTFYLCPQPKIQFASAADQEVSQAIVEAGEVFRAHGAAVEFLDDTLFYKAFAIWQTALADASDYSLNEEFGNGERLSLLKECALQSVGRGRLTLPGLMMIMGEQLFGRSQKELTDIRDKGAQIAAILQELLNEHAMIIMPVFPTVAPKNKRSYLRPLQWNYTTLFSALDFPASAVPFGLNAQGIPLSIQIIGNRHRDHAIAMAARTIEQVKGGWEMPRKGASRDFP